jgi:hypothetical protein
MDLYWTIKDKINLLAIISGIAPNTIQRNNTWSLCLELAMNVDNMNPEQAANPVAKKNSCTIPII